MKLNQVAIQLYTLRDFIKTPEDIAKTLKRVKEIGYQAVQISGMGAIDEGELVKILNGEGLVPCSTHEGGANLFDQTDKVIERLKKLGVTNTCYPWPHLPIDTMQNVQAFAAKLNIAGEKFRKAGIDFCYHNHHLEFAKVEGRVILDILFAETNPDYVKAELDTYWVHTGGYENTRYIRNFKSRLPILHLKDYFVNPEGHKTGFCEIGNGNLPFKEIIAAAEEMGCKWFPVEQDQCPGDPFDSIKTSFNYIKNNLVE